MLDDDKICHCGEKMIKVKVPTIPLVEGIEPKLLNGYHCEKCGSGYTQEEDDIFILRKTIMAIYKKQDELDKELEKNLKALRGKCIHESVIECDYQPETEFFYAQPPARRCIICGIVENGWGIGYQVLTKDPIKIISRDEFYSKMRRLPEIKFETAILIK